jgi:hypothetical protein
MEGLDDSFKRLASVPTAPGFSKARLKPGGSGNAKLEVLERYERRAGNTD